MKITRIISLLLLFSLSARAQFVMEEYLSASSGSSEIRMIEEQMRFIENEGFRSPVLRELEFRVRDTRFTKGLDDYRLRFTGLNPLEQRANRQYEKVIGSRMVTERQYRINRVLTERYLRMIEHYRRSREKEIEEEREKLYQEVLTLAGNQPDEFKVEDVISFDRDLLESRLKISRLDLDIRKSEFIIRQAYPFPGNIDWTDFRFVEVEQVRAWNNSGNSPLPENNLYLQTRAQRNLVEGSELNIRKQESFSNIGFLQAEYRTDPDEPFSSNLGMQLGVNLPIFNIDRPDLNRRRLELMESEAEFQKDRDDLSLEVSLMKMELDALIAQYDLIHSKLVSFNDLGKLADTGESSVDLAVELREYHYELQETELKIYTSLLAAYIELLSSDGRLVSMPLINHLSFSREALSLEF